MIWPPWKRRIRRDGRHRQGEGVDVNSSQDLSAVAQEAREARDRADDALRDTLRRTPEVTRVAQALEHRLERNHWAEMMAQSFQRKAHE